MNIGGGGAFCKKVCKSKWVEMREYSNNYGGTILSSVTFSNACNQKLNKLKVNYFSKYKTTGGKNGYRIMVRNFVYVVNLKFDPHWVPT